MTETAKAYSDAETAEHYAEVAKAAGQLVVDIATHAWGVVPTQGREFDAGYDLHSPADMVIRPLGRVLINTGISVAIPDGYVGFIKPRSGLALKHGVNILGGVIDSGYRGNVGVILHNTDDGLEFKISEGDRIAQLVIQPVAQVHFREVTDLSDSARGVGGFGSTGVSR